MNKRNVLCCIIAILCSGSVIAQNTSFYVDFGPNDVTNGNATINPDVNGVYWNNFNTPAMSSDSLQLIDSNNNILNAYLEIGTTFSMNGINHGGLLAPESSNLGEYAIATATQDYFFTTSSSSLNIKGLSNDFGYVFTFFGTRNTSSTRITEYIVTGSTVSKDSLQTSGTDLGGSGYNGNNSSVVTTDTLYADTEGSLSIDVNVVQGGFAYLGLMKVTMVPKPSTNEFVLLDFGPNDVTNGNSTSSPDLNGNHWNNITIPTSGSDSVSLVNASNSNTGASLKVLTSFSMNGINHGGLLAPESPSLGDFAINTATQDYFFTTSVSSLELSGLSSEKGYIFNLFGTRNTTSTRITEYTITGSNSSIDSLQTSGTDLGGSGYNGNNSTIVTTDTLYADAEGKLTIDVRVVEGGFAYLGVMQMEIIDVEPISPNTAPVADAGDDQLLPTGTTSVQLNGLAEDAENDELTYQWVQLGGPDVTILDSLTASPTIQGLADGNTYSFEFIVSDGQLTGRDQVSISVEAEQIVMIDDDLYQSFYIDFGPDDQINGNITQSPDVNNNYWNNPTNPSSAGQSLSLVNSENETTTLELRVISDLASNGIQNGGLLNPEASSLGDFAIPTATQDYFFTTNSGAVEFRGLDVNRAYVFNIFASRNTDGVRKTKYSFSGSNSELDTLQSSGLGIGGETYNGNNSEILKSVPIRPDAEGSIALRLTAIEGGFGYINTLRVDEVNAATQFLVDFGPNDETNGNSTLSPDAYGNVWNNVINPIASMDTLHLTNKMSGGSDIYLQITRSFQSNGILNGGLLEPNEELLGEFAVNSATEDYFFTTDTSSIKIGGLKAENGYVFHLFGTRNSTSDRVTTYQSSGKNISIDTLKTSGVDLGGAGYNGNTSTIAVTDTLMADEEGTIHLDVIVKSGGFAYLGFMKIDEVKPPAEPEPICTERNDNLIVIMGSSVAFGVGATNNQGYAYLLNQELNDRFNDGIGNEWDMTNISIGGNSTLSLLGRYEADLLPTCGEYVVYGLSLGNEGIKGGGQPIWDQFAENMELLSEIAIENGFTPVIANNYTRADFTLTEYEFIKEMNLFINDLPYPSINLLGAIDDGAGRWATGFQADPFHPNTAGHEEFFYSIVPSLFDALELGKQTPELTNTDFITIERANDATLIDYVPDGIVHPFALSFEIQTTSSGIISEIHSVDGIGYLIVDNQTGYAGYVSSDNDTLFAEKVVNDGEWHTLTLSHYYAWGSTYLYADSTQSERHPEVVELEHVVLGGSIEGGMPETANYRNLMFHRSALNSDEVDVYAGGTIIQSSLELFAPLSEGEVTSGGSYINLAQSTTSATSNISVDSENESIDDVPISFNLYQNYPNPFNPSTNITFDLPVNSTVKIEVFNLLGARVSTIVDQQLNAGSHTVTFDASSLSSGMYFYRIEAGAYQAVQKMILLK